MLSYGLMKTVKVSSKCSFAWYSLICGLRNTGNVEIGPDNNNYGFHTIIICEVSFDVVLIRYNY